MLLFIFGFAISPAIPTLNTDKLYEEFDSPYEDIVKDAIPLFKNGMRVEPMGMVAVPSPPLLETEHGDL